MGHSNCGKTIGSYLDAIQTPGALIRVLRLELLEHCEWDAGAQRFKALFSDEGDFLKQVNLNRAAASPPSTLRGADRRSGGLDRGSAKASGATLHTAENRTTCSASEMFADVHTKSKLYRNVKAYSK